jgi:RNA polymerase sigma factor for flagellar operon FliA
MPLVELVVQRMTPQVPSFMTKEYRVRGAIFDEMRKLDWVSRSMRDKQNLLTRTMLHLERRFGRSPEEDEMAQELSMSLDDYHDLLTEVSHLGCVSLHETLDHSDEGRSFLDNLEDIGGPMPSEILEQQEMTRVMAEILEELSPKERLVIALYYYEELTQKEIAEVLSVSEGRVSQLHSQALLKLRVKLINSELYEP